MQEIETKLKDKESNEEPPANLSVLGGQALARYKQDERERHEHDS